MDNVDLAKGGLSDMHHSETTLILIDARQLLLTVFM
jgi:hypothetical protein